jgi:hypothetical protein
MDVARDRGFRRLTCMLISDLEQGANDVLTPLGFKEYRIPGYVPYFRYHTISKG